MSFQPFDVADNQADSKAQVSEPRIPAGASLKVTEIDPPPACASDLDRSANTIEPDDVLPTAHLTAVDCP